jgi:hypothetical protein
MSAMETNVDPGVEAVLNTKSPELAQLVQRAAADGKLFEALFAGLEAKNETYRYNCYKVVYQVACEQPQAVYPYWDRLASLLDSDNALRRAAAVYLLPRLLSVDSGHRFDAVLPRYLALLADESIVAARYVAQNAAAVAALRPDLQERVVAALLAVRETPHTESRRDLLVSDVLEALNALYPRLGEQEQTAAARLARDYLACSSPRTRKVAKALLREIEGGR